MTNREKKIKRLLEPVWWTWTKWILKKLVSPFVKTWKILTTSKEIRRDWISFYSGFRKINFKLSPASYFDNRFEISFSLGWGQFYIYLPIRSKYDECDPPQYGFYFYSVDGWFPTSFVWCWKRKTKFFYMPWYLVWTRTSVLTKNKEWIHETRKNRQIFWDENKWKDVLWYETQPYTYILENGTVQNVDATIKVEEREWRPRWFKWTKLFATIKRYIDVEFSGEVGERTGTYKGGTMGCGYKILKGETPVQCLRRMERERKF